MRALFQDRRDAGRRLGAELVGRYGGDSSVRVFGLPRGGVPVAYEVARALGASLGVFVVRKLGAPHQKEFAMGAIASGGVTLVDEEVVRALDVTADMLDAVIAAERIELKRRERQYGACMQTTEITGRTVILVDDGIATGSTMRAAVAAVRRGAPVRVVVASPVASIQAAEVVRAEVDDFVCLATPALFQAVGAWYEHFPQTSDAEVEETLNLAREI